jgi:hypothetical protein
MTPTSRAKTTAQAIVKQLQSHFDAFDALGQEHKQSHADTRELWKYTTELHSTLQSIVRLPARYTDLMNEPERLQIHTEHQALMQSLRKMRSDIDTLEGGAHATVTQQKAKLANRANPTDTSKSPTPPSNNDFARLTDLTTADTIPHTFETTTTTHPKTNLFSSTYSNNAKPTDPLVAKTIDLSSVDNTNDMLMSNDDSTNSLSNNYTPSSTSSVSSLHLPASTSLSSSSRSSSQSTVDTSPERPSRIQKQRAPNNMSYSSISNSGKQKNGQYTLLSLPKHSTPASDKQRKQKLNVNFVRQSGNGRVVPVSLQRHLFINATHNHQNRHVRLNKIRQTAPPPKQTRSVE